MASEQDSLHTVGESTDLIPEHLFSEGTTADQEPEASGPSWGVHGDGEVKPMVTGPLINAGGERKAGAMGFSQLGGR